MERERYATLYRPPMPGAIPREGLLEVGFDEITAPSGHHAWGWAEYNHKLSETEVRLYELEYVGSTENA